MTTSPAAAGASTTRDPQNGAGDDAALLGLVAARPGLRALAFTLDAVIALALLSPVVVGAVMLGASVGAGVAPVLIAAGLGAVTLFGLLQLLMHGRRGVTVGKAALRLRSISVNTYGKPGFWRIVLRFVVLSASGIVPLVGPTLMFASGLWDPQHRGRSILDRVAACWLIDARAGLDPFDVKALRHARRALEATPIDIAEGLASMATGAAPDDALRIPETRSRAGVVGRDTGARWQSASGEDLGGLVAAVPGIAPLARPAPEAATPAVAAPAPAASFAPAATAPPASPAAPAALEADARIDAPAAARPRPVLRFDDGTVIRVPLTGLLGRNPEPLEGEQVDAAVSVEDPAMQLSKTHAAFGQDAAGIWIVDRGSSNGTRLVAPDGHVSDAPAGERITVPFGWSVRIGGRSFVVLPRGSEQ
ncbi:MAG: RDD family protein [Actinobacteria bacterium]|nr:RDD family protein [Actinomycetota bacterium]